MKKKVLFIVDRLDGGARKHIVDLIKNINKEKYSLYLIYNRSIADGIFSFEIDNLKKLAKCIEIKDIICTSNPLKDISAYKKIFNIIKQIKPDIIHCHGKKAGIFGRLSGKWLKVNKIYYTPNAYKTLNPTIPVIKSFIYKMGERFLCRYCTTKTINVSISEKEFAIKNRFGNASKFIVINKGINECKDNIDRLRLKKDLGFKDNDIIIGLSSRVNKSKDPWTFVDIANEITKEYKNVYFILIGGGQYLTEIENYIKSKNLEDRVILLGYRLDADRIINAFDIYLNTSLYEGVSYSAIEALRARLPVVASNVAGNTEIVKDNQNGFLFEPRDVSQGVSKLKILLNNMELVHVMGESSYEIFNNRFRLEKMIDEIHLLYEEA